MARFVVEVATNLVGPAVVDAGEVELTVEKKVSTAFAVRYVPEYKDWKK